MECGAFPPMEEAVPLLTVGSLDEVKPSFGRTMDIYAEKLYRCELYQTGEGEA